MHMCTYAVCRDINLIILNILKDMLRFYIARSLLRA